MAQVKGSCRSSPRSVSSQRLPRPSVPRARGAEPVERQQLCVIDSSLNNDGLVRPTSPVPPRLLGFPASSNWRVWLGDNLVRPWVLNFVAASPVDRGTSTPLP